MYIEIIAALSIVGAAIYIMYKSIKGKASGKCSNCSGDCPMCDFEHQKSK